MTMIQPMKCCLVSLIATNQSLVIAIDQSGKPIFVQALTVHTASKIRVFYLPLNVNEHRIFSPLPWGRHVVTMVTGNLCIDNPFVVGPSEMTFGRQKAGNYNHNIITHNVIWVNQKTECFVYHWLWAAGKVWRYVLSRICQSIRRHFKHHFKRSVNTLMRDWAGRKNIHKSWQTGVELYT